MKHLFIFLLLISCLSFAAPILPSDSSQFYTTNIVLKNPGFEAGLVGWSMSTAGSLVITRDAASIAAGLSSGVYNPGSAGNYFESTLALLPNEIKNNYCNAIISLKGCSGSLSASVIDNASSVLGTKTLSAYTSWKTISVPFNCGTSTSVKLRISTVTTSTATCYADNLFINSSAKTFVNNPGQVIMFAGAACPEGYVAADGSLISRNTYSELFSAVSTTWGVGDGSTTFGLPDFRGVFPKGAGTTSRAAGKDASGNYYSAANASYYTDKMQGHWHDGLTHQDTSNAAGSAVGVYVAHNSSGTPSSNVNISGKARAPYTDGTNGTPRTGLTTEPQSAGILFCIKY